MFGTAVQVDAAGAAVVVVAVVVVVGVLVVVTVAVVVSGEDAVLETAAAVVIVSASVLSSWGDVVAPSLLVGAAVLAVVALVAGADVGLSIASEHRQNPLDVGWSQPAVLPASVGQLRGSQPLG